MIDIIVCGGRDYTDRVRVFAVLDEIHAATPIGMVRHGACGWDGDDAVFDKAKLRGADRWAHEWAVERKVGVFSIAALWRRHGRKAGPLRNSALAETRADLCIAFPGGRGTADMVGCAMGAGIAVRAVLP